MTDREKDVPEIAELRSLPREAQPSPALEDRVVAALRREGALAEPHLRAAARLRWPLAIAASVALFALGFYFGGRMSPPGPPPEAAQRYLLLLRQGQLRPAEGAAELERVREYGEWARQLRDAGVSVRGAKLNDAGLLLAGTSAQEPAVPVAGSPQAILGYFVIVAPNLEEGLRIARQCPHLRHGGAIEVRPIDPT